MRSWDSSFPSPGLTGSRRWARQQQDGEQEVLQVLHGSGVGAVEVRCCQGPLGTHWGFYSLSWASRKPQKSD